MYIPQHVYTATCVYPNIVEHTAVYVSSTQEALRHKGSTQEVQPSVNATAAPSTARLGLQQDAPFSRACCQCAGMSHIPPHLLMKNVMGFWWLNLRSFDASTPASAATSTGRCTLGVRSRTTRCVKAYIATQPVSSTVTSECYCSRNTAFFSSAPRMSRRRLGCRAE